jgi:signal transduction histidine kinase
MVLLTGRGDDSVDDAAMNAGAVDYLVKGRTDASMLNRSIRYCLARKHAEAERFALEHQLRQAQKMALVGQLAGGIAHDFNNLLTAILGYAALGENDTALQDGPRASFQEIQKAAQRAADLTQKLLAFSRRQVLEVQLLSLNDVVVNTRSMLRRLIGENIRQEMLTAPDLGLVRADQGQLEQVLINMAINARDAMPAGGKLTVETANVTPAQDHAARSIEPKAERYVMLSISDTGTGIPADVLPHIFEPFFTTKDDGKGTGLGLSTCQGIIEQASGHITAHSDPQTGTTFKIYLPRVDDSVPDPGIGNERQVSRESEGVGAT